MAYVKFKSDSLPLLANIQEILARTLSPNKNHVLKFRSSTDSKDLVIHYYDQYYNNVPVVFKSAIVTSKDGRVISINSDLAEFQTINTNAALSVEQALQFALRAIGAKVYSWQAPDQEVWIKKNYGDTATFYPKGKLVICKDYKITNSKYYLCYQFSIHAVDPMVSEIVFVDANTGAILHRKNLIYDTNSTGTAATRYSGSQSITTDNTSSYYRLQETRNSTVIKTLNASRQDPTIVSSTEFHDNDNNWTSAEYNNTNLDNAALDTHWALEKVSDFWQIKFNRHSLDNNYLPIIANVYSFSGLAMDNAHWAGAPYNFLELSDGYTIFKPLVSLDVVGHESGHGISEYTVNGGVGFTGTAEDNALNEGFSDIFGASVENFGAPFGKQTWLIGEEVMNNGFSCLRSLIHPKTQGFIYGNSGEGGYPDTYLKTNWQANFSDPHVNATVIGHWFYLLSVGGNGTNDNSNTYNVSGIGIDEAVNIAYETEKRMTSQQTFPSTRIAGIDAATSIYGNGSLEHRAVVNSFYAVGIGNNYSSETINGDFPVFSCINATSTFSIGNPGSGISYNWAVSNGLQVVGSSTGNSVTLKVIGNGINIISLQVATPNGYQTVLTKYVTVGVPPLSATDYVDRTPQASHYQYLTSTVTQLAGTVASDYRWYQEVNGVPTTLITTGLQLRNYPLAPCSTLFFRCVITTPCGDAIYRSYAYNTYCSGPNSLANAYIAYPNPANDILTVTYTSQGSALSTDATSSVTPHSFQIILYNERAQILRSGSTQNGSNDVSIETLTISNGTYYLHIIDGSNEIQRQIIISH